MLWLFYEEMKRLFYAMRQIEPEDVDDAGFEAFMRAADKLSNVFYGFELRAEAKRERRTQISNLTAKHLENLCESQMRTSID